MMVFAIRDLPGHLITDVLEKLEEDDLLNMALLTKDLLKEYHIMRKLQTPPKNIIRIRMIYEILNILNSIPPNYTDRIIVNSIEFIGKYKKVFDSKDLHEFGKIRVMFPQHIHNHIYIKLNNNGNMMPRVVVNHSREFINAKNHIIAGLYFILHDQTQCEYKKMEEWIDELYTYPEFAIWWA